MKQTQISIKKIHKKYLFNHIHIYLFLIMSIIPIINSQISKLTLRKVQPYNYALKTQIGNNKININTYLQNQIDWIIQDQCTICQVQNNKLFNNCKDQCYNDKIHGIACNKSYCKKQTKQQSKNLPQFILQSNKVTLKIKQLANSNKLNYPTRLVTKSSKKLQQIGHINLLNGIDGYFGDEVLVVKNNDKDVTVYYTNSSQQKKYQNKENFLIQNVNIVQKLDYAKNKAGIILEYQVSPEKTEDNEQSKSQQQQQDTNQDKQQKNGKKINQFTITKIKLQQLYKDKSQINLKSQQNKQNQNIQITFKSPKKLKFSLETNNLLLPSSIYKKLTNLIIKNYFQTLDKKDSSSSSCQFQQNKLKCTNKDQLKIQKLDNLTLVFLINGNQVPIPIRALVISCGQLQCRFTLGINQNKKQIILGDFILNIFAVKFSYSQNKATLYRLNNQWARDFLTQRQYTHQQVHFIWTLILIVFKASLFILKIIAIFAFVILALNCLYHWRQVFYWFMGIFQKVTKNKLDLKQMNQGYLGNKLNKMSIRIKDRLKQRFRKNKIFYQQVQNSSLNLDQQITNNSQLKQENDKLVHIQEQSDHSSFDQEDQQKHDSIIVKRQNQSKQKIQQILKKAREDLQTKMSQKGQMPAIITAGVISTRPITKIIQHQTPQVNQQINKTKQVNQNQPTFPQQSLKQLLNTFQNKLQNKQIQFKLEDFKQQQQFYQFENNQSEFTDF